MDQISPPNLPQNFSTADLGPISRPDTVTRLFMRVVALAERLNRRYSRVGNPPVYDITTLVEHAISALARRRFTGVY